MSGLRSWDERESQQPCDLMEAVAVLRAGLMLIYSSVGPESHVAIIATYAMAGAESALETAERPRT